MENDLTKICQSIPVSNTGDVSTQAASIMKGLTGEDCEFDINTGDQPTIILPNILPQTNKFTVSGWAGANDNGSFGRTASLKVYVNDVLTDTSQSYSTGYTYNITQQDDGKQIQFKLERTDFKTSESIKYPMSWIDPMSNKISVNLENFPSDTRLIVMLNVGIYQMGGSGVTRSFNGNTVTDYNHKFIIIAVSDKGTVTKADFIYYLLGGTTDSSSFWYNSYMNQTCVYNIMLRYISEADVQNAINLIGTPLSAADSQYWREKGYPADRSYQSECSLMSTCDMGAGVEPRYYTKTLTNSFNISSGQMTVSTNDWSELTSYPLLTTTATIVNSGTITVKKL